MIFPMSDMKIFSPDELGLLFGNAEEDWSRESEPAHCRFCTLELTQLQQSSMPSRPITDTTSTAERYRISSKSWSPMKRTSAGISFSCK